MSRPETAIQTADGSCRASIFRPTGHGPWPGILMFMDGIGYRPAMFEIAEKLAEQGYHVLLPDMFYRMAPYAPVDPNLLFTDATVRADWFKRTQAATSPDKAMADAGAFIDY